LYAAESAPEIQPVLVEEQIVIEVPAIRTPLLGILDVSTEDGLVLDIKTAARAKTQQDVDESMQLSMYHLAYTARTGQPPAGVGLEVLVDTKTPKRQRLVSTRSERDLGVLAQRVNAMVAGVEAGVFLPAAPGSWACSPKFCGFWATCPYVNSERRAAAGA
jgi:hypothetical protein